MNYSEIFSGELYAIFNKALSATLDEKLTSWRLIVSKINARQHPDLLCKAWQQLFEKEKLPVAWMPGPENNSSNISVLLHKLHTETLSQEVAPIDYNYLHGWSVKNKSSFWGYTIQQLGIKFKEKYTNVLNLSKGPENPVWLEGAVLNIAESCFRQEPSSVAIIQGSEDGPVKRITYGALHELVNRIASGLVQSGFKAGDNIVLYMPLTIESIAAYLAIVKAGMAVVSVADSFSPAELKKRIEITQAKAVITCDGYLYGGKVIDVFAKVKEAAAPMAIVADYTGQRTLRTEKGDVAFEALLREKEFPFHYATPDATTNILFSSGTTKEPKAIPWTHLTPIKCASDGYYHQDIRQGDIVTWTTGMGWMMAPWLIYASLINRATIAIFTGAATSEKFGRFAEEEKINVLGTIPSVVKVWKTQDFHKKFHWSSIKVFSSTGEPSNQEDYFYLMTLADLKAPVIEYCGGTEIGGGYITGTVVQPASPATFTTPALGSDFYLMNGQLQPVREGEQGEVFLIPPAIGLTQKLLNKDHHEEYYAGVPVGPQGEVLRKHGDAFDTVSLLDTVFYKSTGRVDDAMNLGGIKVSAIEIESVISKHPDLAETAAISVPGEGGGPEKLIVFYHPKAEIAGTEALKKELQTLLTKELNPLFRIAEIIERKNLPRTASNKLMRRELRKEFMERGK